MAPDEKGLLAGHEGATSRKTTRFFVVPRVAQKLTGAARRPSLHGARRARRARVNHCGENWSASIG